MEKPTEFFSDKKEKLGSEFWGFVYQSADHWATLLLSKVVKKCVNLACEPKVPWYLFGVVSSTNVIFTMVPCLKFVVNSNFELWMLTSKHLPRSGPEPRPPAIMFLEVIVSKRAHHSPFTIHHSLGIFQSNMSKKSFVTVYSDHSDCYLQVMMI